MGQDMRPGILVVEDSPQDRKEIADVVLSGRDARVRYADSVQKAVGVLRSDAIDVVVLDLGLAGTRGRETIAQWHALAPWHGPVIVATISDDDVAKVDCEVKGWAFVRKDSAAYHAELTAALRNALAIDDSGSGETGSKRQREALAESLARMEKRQSEMSDKIDALVQAIDELRRQRLGYWTKDEKGRDVFVEGCFVLCTRLQAAFESGKAIGGQALTKAGIAIAGVIGGGIGTGILWLLKSHLTP